MAQTATLATLIERRGQLLSEAQRIALAEKNTENRAKLATMLADVDQIEKDIEQEQRLAALLTKHNEPASAAIRQNPGDAGLTAENRAQRQKDAIREYVRFGQINAENRAFVRNSEQRDIGTVVAGSINVNGGLLVPQAFDDLLHTAQKSWGQIASIVRTKVTDTGATIKVAGADDTSKSLSVIGEDAAVSENDPALSGLTSSTDVCTTGVIKLSFAELEDSAFDLDSFIRDSFGARYWRGVSSMIVSGNSSNVASLVSGVSNTVTSAAPTTFAWSDFVALLGSIDPAYFPNAKFAINSTTRAAILGIVDSNNRPILNINAASIGGVDVLLGSPVALVQQLPNAAASAVGTILYGDFNATYTFRQVRNDLSILRLNERYADTGMVGFIGYARVGGYLNPLGAAKAMAALVQHS